MSRIDTGAPPDPGPSLGWRFPLRRVGFREFGALLRASLAPFGAAPVRLTGFYFLMWIPIVLASRVPTVGLFLGPMVAAVAFTAYTAALDAAARSEPPDFLHLGVVLRFSRDKMILLMLSGLLPLLVALAVLCAIWGFDQTGTYLDELTRPKGHPSPAMGFDARISENIASMPFAFVQPVWALYRWSGSRSMAANLLACLVNWRWVMALAAFATVSGHLLLWLHDQGNDFAPLAQLGLIVLDLLLLSWTLALAQRSFPPS